MRDTTLTFDIETHSASLMWGLPPEEMFRLGGYAWGDGDVQLTDDLEEMRDVLRQADRVIGHNVHQFDLTVIFGKDSIEPLEMALADKIFDTFADLPVIEPYPFWYTNRKGVQKMIAGPRDAMSYYSLAESAHRWGTANKIMDLKDLAMEYGDPDLTGKEREISGYGRIPTDLPLFREYLIGDVLASRQLATEMLRRHPWSRYRRDEQRFHGILAQCSRNGILIDQDVAAARLEKLNRQKNEGIEKLASRGLPTDRKSPLATKEGKRVIFEALEEVGITPDMLVKTKTGNPSLGGKDLLATVEDVISKRPGDPRNEQAEDLARTVAQISGARMTPETLLNNMQSDGYIHPGITALQRSGRLSFFDPGLTVIGSKEGTDGVNDKKILRARPGHKLVEGDFQAADTRAVVGYSGDEKYYHDYILGDNHSKTASLIWPDIPWDGKSKHPRRQQAKAPTHGSSYRIGARKLAAIAGLPLEDAKRFLKNLEQEYPRRTRWQVRTTDFAEKHGYVESSWGRRLFVDKQRAYNQGVAQLGQNATREMLKDLLLRLPMEVSRWTVGIIHDAVLMDFPEDKAEEYARQVEEAALPFDPPGGMRVEFPLVMGHPADNWYEANH